VVRAPLPADAQPVTRVGAVAGGSQTWIAQVAARTTEQLEVAVVAQSPSLNPLASATVALLTAQKINAYQAELADVRRPDVILLLGASEGGASVWYCSPSQSASATLADTLLAELSSLTQETGEDATSTMPCESLHLGRASSAAALVRLPNDAEDPSKLLATAVERYLDENAVAIRRGRQALRMTWPAVGPITSHYGPDHPLGIDIGQSAGPILAATDGTVIFAGGDPCCSYGRFVVITGPGDVTTVYGHLETLAVKEGDTVRLGQPLGEVGCTGRCFGTHLHFEVIKNGTRLNPMDYLP
jgi:murein DD-endopeptidase MepM/ murein hydrolase activator NlpD